MLSFVGTVLRHVWGADEVEDDTDAPENRSNTTEDGGNGACPSSDLPTTQGSLVVDCPSQQAMVNRRTFTGYVTSVHSDYGLVDHQVYFGFNLCKSFAVPKVGAKVCVTAERKHSQSGWNAVTIVPVTDDEKPDDNWDKDDKNNQVLQASINTTTSSDSSATGLITESVVAMVTGVTKNTAFLSENLTFDLSSCTTDFIPSKGDWVTANTSLDSTSGERKVSKIEPLRVWDFEGEVNSVQVGFGYINTDIYFSITDCVEGYKPQRKDRVRGRAIECSRGRCPWRAIQVIPIQELPDSTTKSPKLQTVTNELLANKDNVKITEFLQFGDMQIGQTKPLRAFIRNESTQTQILMKCRICAASECQIRIEKLDFVPPNKSIDQDMAIVIPPGKVVVVHLSCTARNLGMDEKLLVFQFKSFSIGRYVSVNVHDTAYREILDPSSPYQKYTVDRNSQSRGAGEGWLLPGQRPMKSKLAIKLPNRLPQFPVPPYLDSAYREGDSLTFVAPVLNEDLCLENYTDRFSVLLHLEEIQQEIDIRQFDLHRVALRPFGEYLALAVPGLAEGRPSVLVGDSVILSSPGVYDNEPDYEGCVHEVMSTEVLLKFHTDFHNKYNGEDYNVRFTLNRTTTRRCQQAVKFAPNLGGEVLFPTKLIPKVPQTKVGQRAHTLGTVADVVKVSPCGIKRGPRRRSNSQTQKHEFFNPRLNARQKASVLRILSGQSRPTPYLLFGPPGTGKTVTTVEALLQVYTQIPFSRIIACTPSNSAADLLCQHLHMSRKLKLGDMVRLNSYSRSEDSIPAEIRPYCKNGDDLELVSRHRLLICTCTSAGMMYSLGLRTGHFTHVFIDEAGQATEAEVMIPVGLIAGADGQVVLAGDPMQLGPVLQSQPAKDYGLGLSFLERLIQSRLYVRNEQKFADHGNYDPLLVTKLVENYRSHESLLKLPSLLFYYNELLPAADPAITDLLITWEKLPNKDNFPILFHGIRGEDMREGNSPSWFNPKEALQVMRYLQALSTNLSASLTFDDIGIITPYRKQVEKIRLLIDSLGMDKVKVGSVEEFQGQERLVMIISTVRSKEGLVKSDVQHNLGFLSNPKRFNVAISRAQALMVVIGNPHILSQDENWKILIKYCVENNAYVGCDVPELTLKQDIDLTPCKRHRLSSDKEIGAKSSSIAKEIPLAGIVSLAKETQNEDVTKPAVVLRTEGTCSESDGDDTLSINSADTEISVKFMQSKATSTPDLTPTEDSKEINYKVVLFECPQSSKKPPIVCDNESQMGKIGSTDETSVREQDDVKEPIFAVTEQQQAAASDKPDVDEEISLDIKQEHTDSEMLSGNALQQHDVNEHTTQKSLSDQLRLNSPKVTDDHTDVKEKGIIEQQMSSVENYRESPGQHLSTTELRKQSANLPPNKSATDGDAPSSSKRRVRRSRRNTAERLIVSFDNINQEKIKGTSSSSPSSCASPQLGTDWAVSEPFEQNEFWSDSICTKDSNKEQFDASGAVCNTQQSYLNSLDKEGSDPSYTTNHIPDPNGNIDSLDHGTTAETLHSGLPTSTHLQSTNHHIPMTLLNKQLDQNCNSSQADLEPVIVEQQIICSSQGTPEMLPVIANNPSDISAKPLDIERLTCEEPKHNFKMDTTVTQKILPSGESSSSFTTASISTAQSWTRQDFVNRKIYQENVLELDQDTRLDDTNSRGPVAQGTKSSINLPTNHDRDMSPLESLPSGVNKNHSNLKRFEVTELEAKIIRQVEYYFGSFNMSKDTFMQKLISKDSGWIKLEMLITFKRLRALSTDFIVICNALQKSDSGLLEVDSVSFRIRRSLHQPLPEDFDSWKLGLRDRSAFVIGLKTETQSDELKQHFQKWGNIEHIQLLQPQKRIREDTMVTTYPFVLVYHKPADAKALLATKRGIDFKGSRLYAHFRKDILDMLYSVPKQNRKRHGFHNSNSSVGNHLKHPAKQSPMKNSDQSSQSSPAPAKANQDPTNQPLRTQQDMHSTVEFKHFSDDCSINSQGAPKSSGFQQGALFFSDADGIHAVPQPQRVLKRRGRGLCRGYIAANKEPEVGRKHKSQDQTFSSAEPSGSRFTWSVIGRGRGRGIFSPTTSSAASSSFNALCESIEQDDSDVIIESSEEEFF